MKTRYLTTALFAVTAILLLIGLMGCEENAVMPETEGIDGMFAYSPTSKSHGDGEECVALLAGQNIPVGQVCVWNDDILLYVKYELSEYAIEEGWLITETHLHVGETLADFPLTRQGNPIPGRFDYKEDHDPGVTEFTYDEIALGWDVGDDLLIAAHAVIEKVECETLAEAPYGGSRVVDNRQAWRIDHTPENPRYVRTQRSNPDNALKLGTPGQETFYSLGYGGLLNYEETAVETFFGVYFEDSRDPDDIRDMESRVDEDLAAKLSDTENNAGWIIIEFDYPVLNLGEGTDLQVVEDTWGLPYPLELAAVFGKADPNDDWTFLFLAHNQEPEGNGVWTITNGGLGDLEYASQILVQDVSNPQWFIPYPHNVATLDGYDLNAVLALNDHIVCEEFDETAWAYGDRFVNRGNWATYFTYTITCGDGNGECQTETAWGGNTAGGGNAWWYYYVASEGGEQTVWAGQTIEVGTVEVVDGVVTIVLTDGWELQDGDETVKIKGYDENELPDKRPAAGQLTTYKGTDLTVTVDNYAYYAIHLDVQLCP